jgi:hypothetical protein
MFPTSSTFGLKTTSKPVCANLSGKYNLEGGSHSHTAAAAIFGAPKGALKPDTTMFKKKYTGNPILIDKNEGKRSELVDVKRLIFQNCVIHLIEFHKVVSFIFFIDFSVQV